MAITERPFAAPSGLTAVTRRVVPGPAVVLLTVLATVLATLTAGLVATPASGAAPGPTGWVGAPVEVPTPGEYAFDAGLAVAEDGTATAVWTTPVGAAFVIRSATKPRGGAWSAPQDLGTAAVDDAFPRVGVDGSGAATVIWRDLVGSHRYVWSVSRPAGGGWTGPVLVSDSTAFSYVVTLAVGADGTATAVWASSAGPIQVVVAATRSGGAWGAPVGVSPTDEALGTPSVTVDAVGRSTVVWPATGSAGHLVRAASRPATGGWTPAVALTDPVADPVTSVGGAFVRSDRTGTAWAAFTTSATGTDYLVRVAHLPPAGSWSTTETVAGPDPAFASSPVLAAGADGTVALVWRTTPSADHMQVRAVVRSPAGSWSPPADLTPALAFPTSPRVGVGPDGAVTAVWGGQAPGGGVRAQSASGSSDGAWGPTTDLAPTTGSGPGLGIDAQGNGVALWVEAGQPLGRIVSRSLDAEGPSLALPALPVAGYANHPLPFTVAPPTDSVSAVTTTWSFGDGGSAIGASVAHTFADGGTFPVTVTATDEAGHTTSRASTVTVTGHPVLTGASLSRHRLHADGTRKQRRTRLSYRLSAPAKVVVTLVSIGSGHRRKARVVRHGLATGQHALVLRLRIQGQRLAPGRYRVTLTPSNPAGAGPVTRLTLRVVGPPPG